MLYYLKEESNMTYTENGGTAYRSTESFCLDMFFKAGAMRNSAAGEIADMVNRAYAEDPDAEVYTFTSPGMTSHQMINTEKAPTDDINVRKAMIYAVDQDQISQTAFNGFNPPAHSLISPTTWAFSKEADDMYRKL